MKNPQGGSASSSSSGASRTGSNSSSNKTKKALPPLFWYMEMGEWEKATDRAKRHPREAKTWATLRTKSMADAKVSGTKRLALHHACFKLRSVVPNARHSSTHEDSFVEVCKFILLLISMHPEASGMRESRHGCLPLHLAAFASCAPRPKEEHAARATVASNYAAAGATPIKSNSSSNGGGGGLSRPQALTKRSTSESTASSSFTNMSDIFAEEKYTGTQTAEMGTPERKTMKVPMIQSNVQNVSVAQKSNVLISAKREDMAVKVINALLDAYPKGIKVDSEGGRLPLHTACAGRASPRVISTLITAYPAAARHRNKDGFLPLHLAAHWGVSHPNVAIALLKAYPDSTLGRNRWERTPLEEALCMAGENGRPHQAALVRALRKHPSYWTRPPEELFRTDNLNERLGGPTRIDTDLTLPDDETSLDEEERRYFNSGHSFLLEEENEGNGGGMLHNLSPRGRNRKGKDVPLHHMMSLPTLIKNQNWTAVIARIEDCPHEAGEDVSAMTRGGFMATRGLTPLHYACERRPPMEVVSALIAAWPEAISTRLQPGGALPLHVASTWHAPEASVKIISQAEPAACRIPDDLGNIPLHCSSFSGAAVPVVDILLRTFSKAVLARNHQGSLPGDIVKRLRHDNRRMVTALLNASKEEILAVQHRRSRSSGSCGAVAQRAAEMNQQSGVPPKTTPEKQQILTDGEEGQDVDLEASGVEVTYDAAEEKESELVWI